MSEPPAPAWRSAFAVALSPGAIAAALPPDAADWVVEAVEATGSTNEDLLLRARRAAPGRPILRSALEQSAGRGRLGRIWSAPRGSALLFSVALPLAADRAPAPATALACGVALARVLRRAGAPVELKWPNDLIVGAGKLAGILAELALDGRRIPTLVVGVGVNLWRDAAADAALAAPAAALVQYVDPWRLAAAREQWLGRLAGALAEAAADVAQRGFAPWRAEFNALFGWRGRQVELRDRDISVATGTAEGVDDDGRLVVATVAGPAAFASGDVSLRLQEPAR